SYPARIFFRSQHSKQSCLDSMIRILDTSALVIDGNDNIHNEHAKLTFAMARHAVVDLAQVVNARYDPDAPDRLPPAELGRLRDQLAERGLTLKDGSQFNDKLSHLRTMYEPYSQAVARRLFI